MILGLVGCGSGSGLQVGDVAPPFKLYDQNDQLIDSKDLKGKKHIVLYFYPKDDTPGCTKEAYAFRRNYEEFTQLNAVILGVSSDNLDSHKNFATKCDLPYSLLSDVKSNVRKTYDVSALLGVIPGRKTFVIDKEGIIRHIFDSQFSPEKHIEEALETLQSMSNEPGK
ncbi:MAG: peroxiredoxin [Bacteroidetes bacterium]|nr:peroxiredoxin [Bacteroidota bacterium]